MKEVIRDVLDLKVPMLIYETVDEGDKAAGRVGAVLDECNTNLMYRGANADARDLIVTVAMEVTKLELKTKTVKKADKEVQVPDETEQEFVERALASGKLTKDVLQTEVERRARNGWSYQDDGATVTVPPIAVDIKGRERKPTRPPKLAQEFKTAAESLLGQYDDVKINTTLKKYLPAEKAVFKRGTTPADKEKNVEGLGWLIRDYQKAKLAQGVL